MYQTLDVDLWPHLGSSLHERDVDCKDVQTLKAFPNSWFKCDEFLISLSQFSEVPCYEAQRMLHC